MSHTVMVFWASREEGVIINFIFSFLNKNIFVGTQKNHFK